MPLIDSATSEALHENIRREIHAGRKPKQAAAIGYAMQRRAKKKKRAASAGY